MTQMRGVRKSGEGTPPSDTRGVEPTGKTRPATPLVSPPEGDAPLVLGPTAPVELPPSFAACLGTANYLVGALHRDTQAYSWDQLPRLSGAMERLAQQWSQVDRQSEFLRVSPAAIQELEGKFEAILRGVVGIEFGADAQEWELACQREALDLLNHCLEIARALPPEVRLAGAGDAELLDKLARQDLSSDSVRHGGRRQVRCHGDARRFDAVVDLIRSRFGDARYIADVAGGQGVLSRLLTKKMNMTCEVIDPRGHVLKGVDNRAEEFDPAGSDYYDLVVGLHPDQAIRPVVEASVIRPTIVVPCCNFWVPERMALDDMLRDIGLWYQQHDVNAELIRLDFAGPYNRCFLTSPPSKKGRGGS